MRVENREKAEFIKHLDLTNMKRVWLSSVGISLLLTCLILTGLFFDDVVPVANVFFVVAIIALLIQVISAYFAFYLVKRRNIDLYERAYRIYYSLTMLTLMVFAVFDYIYCGSTIAFVLGCGYFVCVPLLKKQERFVFYAVLIGVTIYMIMNSEGSLVRIAELIILTMGTFVSASYQHNMKIRLEKMSQNLRNRIIVSEQDALTGLTNRRGLENKAETIWSICQRKRIPVAIIALDIDYFKKYNDKFGHPQGDRCLRLIADSLKETVRRNTDVVTRTGGEEFLIFLQDITPKDALSLALKIRKNIDAKAIPHAYCAISKNVTVSMGIATIVPGINNRFIDLYEAADRELYLAKQNGRNCIVFDGNLYGRIRNGMAQVVEMR